MATTETMRAWTYCRRGAPSSVLELSTIPKPETSSLGPNQVIVKVLYAGIFAPYANLIRKFPHFTSKPWIPELEFSGVVEAVGLHVKRVQTGDEVFGGQDLATHFMQGGTVAQYIVLHEDLVVRKPETVSLQEAAGLGPIGCTVVQFVERSQLKAGAKVLITAAASMTGMAMVQIARHVVGESGRVIGTCSDESAKMVKEAGADETLNYKTPQPLHEYLIEHHSNEPFDLIIDVAGDDHDLYGKSPPYLTEKGTFIFAGKIDMSHNPAGSMLSIITWVMSIIYRTNMPTILGGTPRTGYFHSGAVEKQSLDRVAELARDGHIRLPVSQVYEMEELLKAYEAAESGRKGKVVIRVQ